MGFRVSPGVSVTEKDLTTIVPAVATTPGGFAGQFQWGPCEEVVTVASEKELVTIFGKPSTESYVDFFTAANFLGYGNNCGVVRVVSTGTTAAKNAWVGIGGTSAGISGTIKNRTEFVGTTYATSVFASKWPGVLGNSLKVVVLAGDGTAAGGASYATMINGSATMGDMSISVQRVMGVANTAYSVGDKITFLDGTTVYIKGVSGSSISASTLTNNDIRLTHNTANPHGVTFLLAGPLPKSQAAGATFTTTSVYASNITTTATQTVFGSEAGGSNDLINVLVLDSQGKWSGTANTVLEKFEAVSRAQNALGFDGSSNYYRNVINDTSKYIWATAESLDGTVMGASMEGGSAFPLLSTLGTVVTSAVKPNVLSLPLVGAADGEKPNNSERYQNGWLKFADPDAIDVALLPLGNADSALSGLVIQNIAETRKDCMAFASPGQTDVVNKAPYEALNSIKTFRDSSLNINSSYAVLDSGWKYQLDVYNNVIRTMPLNPDIAGLVARTEFVAEAWFSPAGFNRGQIKNAIKLAYNPSSEAHRDELYTRQINPVVSFPGEGTVLFGDKTMQTKPSAFDRINVRRLFIILEKSIATASKFFLFEQNDAFTRAQFKNMIVPFLKTVQSRRGITDFLVVCDDTNNPGDVIDRNEFVADIFIKPTRTINFIQLNFVATKTGVSFSEVAGV